MITIAPPTYCVGACTCGQNCHENVDLHRNTGALTQDEYADSGQGLASEIAALRGQSWDLQLQKRGQS